jgi:hypothetical protein
MAIQGNRANQSTTCSGAIRKPRVTKLATRQIQHGSVRLRRVHVQAHQRHTARHGRHLP